MKIIKFTLKHSFIDRRSLSNICHEQQCCYCQDNRKRSQLIRVPKKNVEILEWIRVHGPKFAKCVRLYPRGLVCRNHFLKKWKCPEKEVPSPNDADDDDIEVISHHKFSIPITVPKPKTVREQFDCKKNEKPCRICEDIKDISEMSEIPEPPMVRKWKMTKKEEFIKSLSERPGPHYLCTIHLADLEAE